MIDSCPCFCWARCERQFRGRSSAAPQRLMPDNTPVFARISDLSQTCHIPASLPASDSDFGLARNVLSENSSLSPVATVLSTAYPQWTRNHPKDFQHMQTIVLATQKGGSGKSTLAVGLALAARQAGHIVRLIETDQQGTLSRWQ